MWRFCAVLLAGCGFSPGALPGDAGPSDARVECTAPVWALPYAHRYAIETGGAPAGYTLHVDATAALTVSAAAGADLRVFTGATELDRIVEAPFFDVQVPAAGSLYLYVGDPLATGAPANPANVYLFAESFDGLAAGDNASIAFDPQPATEWSVVDDGGGNHIYRALGASRHPAAIRNLTLPDGDIRARMRVGAATGQQHNGLASRGNSMIPATMDGFVGQLQGDVNRTRIAEYSNGISPPAELIVLDKMIDRGIWYALRLRYIGAIVELYIDGTLTLTATQPTSDGQLVGLFAHDCDVDYDDVTVRMAISPEPTAALGAREDRCP